MILHEAVLFDLDGTLVDSARFWCRATREGFEVVYRARGIEEAAPSRESIREAIGLSADESLAALVPGAHRDLLPEIGAEIARVASAGVEDGELVPFPGAAEALRALRGEGCKVGVATNASGAYREACLGRCGLRALVDVSHGPDSARASTKAGVVARALEELEVRRAVVVGDRAQDREAAHANGLPFVAFRGGYGREEELRGAEASVETFAELLDRLRERTRSIDALAAGLLAQAAVRGAPLTVGVTGPLGAGKTGFARDLARLLRARGGSVEIVPLDSFAREEDVSRAVPADEDHLGVAFDLTRFLETVGFVSRRERLAGGSRSVAIVEGLFLLDERVRRTLDVVVHLEAAEETILRRVRARSGPLEEARARDRYLPAQEAFADAHPPSSLADLRVDNTNPLNPVIRGQASLV
jgi:phosphoglycolate phosphatase-like HAD superfamily hydrolase/dephospho-CoA kinase